VKLLRDAAAAARVDLRDIELLKLLDALAIRYRKLAERSQTSRELEQHVRAKLRERSAEIAARKMRIDSLQSSVRCAERELQAAAQREKQLSAMRRAECRDLRSAARGSGIPDAADRAPDDIALVIAERLREQVRLLRQTTAVREQKTVELTRGIRVVEQATREISRANVRLIHELRIPSSRALGIGINSVRCRPDKFKKSDNEPMKKWELQSLNLIATIQSGCRTVIFVICTLITITSQDVK
jgi:hypothetical protein